MTVHVSVLRRAVFLWCFFHIASYFSQHYNVSISSNAVQGVLESLLVVGSLEGCLIAFDTSRMEIAWTQSLGRGSISCVTTSKESNTLVAITQSGKAVVLDIRSGGKLAQWDCPRKIGVTKVASLLDNGHILLAGTSICVVDSTTGALAGSCSGHATAIIHLAAEQDYFCSVAAGDRDIAIWSTHRKSVSGKFVQKSALSRISLNHPLSFVSMCKASTSTFHLVAVTLSGSIHVFKCTRMESNTESLSIYEWARSENGGLPVVQVAIDSAVEDKLQLSVVCGTFVKPVFSTLALSVPSDGSEMVSIVKPSPDADILMKNPHEFHFEDKHVNGYSVADQHAPAYLGMHDSSSVESDDGEEFEPGTEINMTFGERIASLVDAHVPDAASTPEKGDIPRFDSLSVLLSQAISNGDSELLEKCLSLHSAKTIGETTKHLPPRDVAALLALLVSKVGASPGRGEILATWIKSILIHHVGYISGTGVCKRSLVDLYQLMDTRLTSYVDIMSLRSRLGLVLTSTEQETTHPEACDHPTIDIVHTLGGSEHLEMVHNSAFDTVSSDEERSSEEERSDEYYGTE